MAAPWIGGLASYLRVRATSLSRCLSSSIGENCRKYHFCRDKHVFKATKKSFVATKVCLPRQNFCRDKKICRDKTFVATNICRDKHVFVATKMMLVAAPASDIPVVVVVVVVCQLVVVPLTCMTHKQSSKCHVPLEVED